MKIMLKKIIVVSITILATQSFAQYQTHNNIQNTSTQECPALPQDVYYTSQAKAIIVKKQQQKRRSQQYQLYKTNIKPRRHLQHEPNEEDIY